MKKTSVLLTLLACTLGTASARDFAAIKASGTLVVGTEPTYAPFTYTQGKKIVGFEAELAEALAKRMGLKVEWKPSAFDTLLIGLNQDRFDMVIASHGITPERQKAVDFARPHYCSGGVILAPANGPLTVAALKGKTVAVQLGTTYAERAQSLPGLGSVKTYPNNAAALQMLLSKRVDAFITDRFVAIEGRKKFPQAKLKLGEMLFQEKIGIAVKKGNTTVTAAINTALGKMLADGSYKKLSEKYFGEDIRCK
ncbi:extracellular solute-binding protein [Deinococcus phoenicis]|uniref:Extracellular solute-binding protein n=1 Tax=Deinococcus phoenicis TaxID=1476583 RepID=A0A016QS86_9DEIO|nr:ABC transporter substrate-binding protein [Deinococcus phoenicis]EYB68624.1 extracellular solute-binding protein [Deinococcus phoenicis]